MGRKCNVLDCPSDSKRSEDNGVTFHKMPFHSDLRPKWIELCRIPEDRQLNKVIYVCSRHFRRTDFCNFKGTKYMLKQGALPSVFPWTRCLIKLPNGGNKSDDASNSDVTEIKLEPIDSDSKSNDEIDISNIKEEPMDEDIEIKEEPIIEEEKIPKIIKKDSDIKPKMKKEKKETSVKKESDVASLLPSKLRDDAQICISFFPGTRIEANDFNDKWYPASILEVDYEENEVFVEFDKHLNRANEWIPMDSSRLRPYVGSGTADFVVGEKCMATWMNSCSKFPATIKKVLDGDNYEVLFDDGFTKILKHCKLSKIKDPNNIPLPPKAPIPHAAPLFEPVVGSKEDRRERKRKINVAQLFGRKKSKSDDPHMRMEDDEKYDLPELNKSIPALAYGDGEEWTCRWLNGEPIGLESTLESPDGTRRSIIVPDHRLPPGWEKHLTQRIYGNSAGKWDSILVNPDGKKFANRQQLKVWFEENKLDYNIENFDFSLHINRAKKLGLYEITDPELTAANLKPNQQQKPGFPKLKGAKTQNSKSASSKSPATPDIPVLEPEIEEENNPEASLKIIHENDSYKCPIEGCGKNFRKENLAQMHIKHYHPEYSKLIGSTPNVADLAYARTVGEHIDEIVPPKLKPVTSSPLIEKDKSFKAESSSSSSASASAKPKSTIKVLTPKTQREDKSNERIPNLVGSPGISSTKTNAKDSEIIRLLNSEPKTKMDSIFDSVEIHKQLTADEAKSSPDRYPEIKLRDLLNKSEPIPYKKDEFNHHHQHHRPFGIKTLLPVHRRNSEENKNDLEAEVKAAEQRNKMAKRRQSAADKRRQSQQSFKYDTDDMSDYCEADSHSQDSFKAAKGEVIAAPPAPLPDGQVIIEGGEVIRLVHMRSEEIINCTCGITEEDGLMIQCELCLCWQHAHCNNIAKENEVPDKYICKICKNPQRMRQSKKYTHDQDWLKQGVLATANYHSRDPKVLDKRFEMLRKSHELSGCVLELNEYLHHLRIKLNVAESKDHPKLYLWAKPWDKPLPSSTLNLQKPENKDDMKEESFNRSFASSDHSYIKSSTAFSEMALKTMLEPLEDLKNEIENPDLDMDMKLPVDTKIKSQSELISILEDDEPSTSTSAVTKMDTDENTSFPKIDLNSIIVNNLTDKIETKNDVLNKEEALNSITSGILSTTSLDLALAQLSGVVAAPEVVHIPQPEAVIDSSDCKLNLLDHVAHYQNLIEERLNSVEAVLYELEGEDSNPLPEDDEYDSKTKQTLQMLIRDLGTMREIAAINN